ncbi:MAG: uroporphyrinogen decarboxylase, partial [Actinobacteria bacterium]|nr:uroporphyrinogen decarboxylase [Actinomycetota bacterium]
FAKSLFINRSINHCSKPLKYHAVSKILPPKADKWGEVLVVPELAKALGIDFIYIKAKNPQGDKKIDNLEGLAIDEWGVVRKKVFLKDSGYYWDIIKHPLKDCSIEDLKDYPWPSPDNEKRYEKLDLEAENLYKNTDFCLIGRFGGSIFETAWYLRGFEQWLIDLLINKDFAKSLMEKICSIQMRIDERCLELTGKYINILKLAGDDLGGQEGSLISPDIFREMVKPFLCKRWQTLKSKFKKINPYGYIMFHTCGNVYSLIPDFIECGLDILDPIQNVKGMEIERLKSEFGDKLTFHGAVDTQYLLRCGTPPEVKSEVKRLIKILGVNGGFIISPVHNVQSDVPIENLIALSEAVKMYCI